MTMPHRLLPARRPSSPRCRGGASSMLRLANPWPSGAGAWVGGAPVPSPVAGRRAESEAALIVTGLQAPGRSAH